MRKRKESRSRLRFYINGISILVLFVTFFFHYLTMGVGIIASFIHGVITYVVSSLALGFLYSLWKFSFPPEEWRLIINGTLDENDLPDEQSFPILSQNTSQVD